jgi:glutamyl-tRNA synthetase/glutamyl-Q tRNA(Asp) synthetase
MIRQSGMRPDLPALRQQLPRPLTRFAPSPTGYLHLGHVVNAIYVWGVAGAANGRVLLRIEDHDRIRSRTAYETAILEDLRWLGFEPDAGSTPPRRQSDHQARYERALDTLRAAHHVYACGCSRQQIGGERYDGRCRGQGYPATGRVGLRVELAPGTEAFTDLVLGRQAQTPAAQCGDLLLKDRDGHWTYQFAVTVDDLIDGITLVIRGADLLPSTGRQLQLARMLGRITPPLFLHHPLIVRPDGNKLSKASGDSGIRELRAAGLSAAEVIGRAAAAVGLIETARPIAAREVAELFR